MLKTSKRKVILLIILISVIAYLSINFFLIYNLCQKKQKSPIFILNTNPITNTNSSNIKEIKNEEVVGIQYKSNDWRIKIQKLNIDAPIIEGTTLEVLKRGVGHFSNTSAWEGNICLAAHNRGYRCNYFQEIKKLELGDIITYETKKGIKNYKVELNKIIEETDLSYIQDTKENKITLITCEENKPKYRRCIQAKEI